MAAPVRIVHFSDVLCVWAYVSQVRMDELLRQFAGHVEIEARYLQVFGDVPAKMQAQWAERGGVGGYARHVREVAAGFGHVRVHPDAWSAQPPQSSLPAHLLICAVRLLESRGEAPAGAAAGFAWAVRDAFFAHAVDVSRRSELLGIAERSGLTPAAVEALLDHGAAHAALCEDLDLARDQMVRASPTLIFNEGRQRLTGNVGYRIIEANVRELVENRTPQLSWC